MDVKIGDTYIRNLDGKVYRVRRAYKKTILLESDEKGKHTLTDIFGLENIYKKKEPSH